MKQIRLEAPQEDGKVEVVARIGVRAVMGHHLKIRGQTGKLSNVIPVSHQSVVVLPIQLRQRAGQVADVGPDTEVLDVSRVDNEAEWHLIKC